MWHGFRGRLLIFGCGGVSSCFVDLIHRHFHFDPRRMILIDKDPPSSTFLKMVGWGALFQQRNLTPETLGPMVREFARPGDFVVDLTVNVDTIEFLQLCQERQVHYMNAALEQWIERRVGSESTEVQTLYERHMALKEAGLDPKGPTALLDSGANPGLVSHFVKAALEKLAREFGIPSQDDDFPRLAMRLGVEAIHISEWDTQDGEFEREEGEFQNTWSIEGLIEESQAPAEMGWSTEEPLFPADGVKPTRGPGNQIFLTTPGCRTRVRSWVPSGPIDGMVIRHGEAFTLSRYLTVEKDDKAVYRPTVHYAYYPSRAARESLQEWVEAGFSPPHKQTLLTDQLEKGRDELGVLLMGEKIGAWWFGSLLDLQESRNLVPGHSATTVQVAAGLLCGMEAVLQAPHRGVLVPEDLDHRRALEVAAPFLGPLVFQKADWTPSLKPGFPGSRWAFENLRVPEGEVRQLQRVKGKSPTAVAD